MRLEQPLIELRQVIGRNGAGKSTLLQLMARVLTPTLRREYVRADHAHLSEREDPIQPVDPVTPSAG